MEFDTACAEIETAGGFLDRVLSDVEADEGNKRSARALGVSEDAIVGLPECRVPVRLVEAEDKDSRDVVALGDRHQFLVGADHFVEIGSEMDMSIENRRDAEKLSSSFFRPAVDQLPGADERFIHLKKCMWRLWRYSAPDTQSLSRGELSDCEELLEALAVVEGADESETQRLTSDDLLGDPLYVVC